ncbi:LysR family transcriptional regulator [Saccharobesus litoralis]|uniref:LysR family transcriptional regulator n=1 Tax=Saccharobesus litoralis TaxID=2172099 RepID=A0A2S0VQ63_9ALTE|nr:LysR family transcriptional regulator [Saccharobesus litoralis]AWB66356.1 LysR family transcriptional regulator [Saccharobesus litoralis]
MKAPTFRQLQLVKALDEFNRISVVAEQLHISQPSVSIQLKNLTETVGLPVYRAKGKKLELTEAGRALLECADEIDNSFKNLSIKLDDIKGLNSGTLKLSVVSTAKYFLPLLLGAFCKQHPKIDIQLKIGNRKEVIKRLNTNEDDFYFFSHTPEDVDIETQPFLDNELVVVAPERHELAQQESISLARLSHYPLIMREQGSGTRRSIEEFFQTHGVTFNEKMTIESNEAIKYAVAAGLGLSILSRHTLDYGQVPGLIKLNVEKFPIQNSWYLVKHVKRSPSLLSKAFEKYMIDNGIETLRRITNKNGY